MIEKASLNSNSVSSFTSNDLKQYARDTVRMEMRRLGEVVPNTSKVYRKLDQFLDLGTTKDLQLNDLTIEERDQFTKMLGVLLSKGIVGWQWYKVNGKMEKHYIVNSTANPRLKGAPVINRNI